MIGPGQTKEFMPNREADRLARATRGGVTAAAVAAGIIAIAVFMLNDHFGWW